MVLYCVGSKGRFKLVLEGPGLAMMGVFALCWLTMKGERMSKKRINTRNKEPTLVGPFFVHAVVFRSLDEQLRTPALRNCLFNNYLF